MFILLILLGFVVALWSLETIRHRRALSALPVRIHINGSRGKSSVTRLMAAALREGGKRTFAKVTGSKARMILTDGTDEPVVRLGTPNILEQLEVLNRARREKAEIMVMECMAVRPDLQKTTEEMIMHSTIGVITNVRPDHLDVMGPTMEDVAIALSSTVPRNGVVVLGDPRYAALIRRVARERGSRLIVARAEDVAPEAMSGFAYLEHEENVATVLAVTRMFDIPDEVALRGMYKAEPDVGVCSRWEFALQGCEVEFHNVFAANDMESTLKIWEKLGLDWTSREGQEATVALLNLRADRIDRSLAFAEAVERALRADHYLLVGKISDGVLRRFQQKIPAERLLTLGEAPPEQVFGSLCRLGRQRIRVGGVGNIGGPGHDILRYAADASAARFESSGGGSPLGDAPLPAGA